DAIAATRSKLAKIDLLAGFLRSLPAADVELGARYFAGGVFPAGDARTLNVGGAAFRTALLELGGIDDDALRRSWRRHADLGDVVREVLETAEHQGGVALTLHELDAEFATLAATSGSRAKAIAMRDLLGRSSPAAARYIGKLVSGEMHIGLREGLVEEAIARAFDATTADVSRAMMLVGDAGAVAALAAQHRLGDAAPVWFVPLRFMLATPVADADEAVARMGDDVWVEDKYDGIRCQLHRRGDRVELYSRDLRTVTGQFPEVVTDATDLGADVVLDGEILAFGDGRVLPFQVLQTRLGRVAPSTEVQRTAPVIYVAWDLLMQGEEVLLDAPLRERRRRLEGLALPSRIALAHLESVRGAAEVDRRFDDARARLNEGLMLKRPDSPYTPGRRGLSWLKLKRPLDTLDVVVIGAEWGHGKRRGVLSDVTFAVRVDGSDELVPIGKAYSGLTDEEIATMTRILLDTTVSEHGPYRAVRPEIVLEVAFDLVQESTRHRSGYALRFPRIARWRHDKTIGDIDTLNRVRELSRARSHDRVQLIDSAPRS
ncbi:MAG: ATP-dependent DNA ligase, partial [Candidatus Dormibacteraeota bacterium]|nr:ATP-dependent DNA ligase [Candidatus Dormibacteraeota bacterium]